MSAYLLLSTYIYFYSFILFVELFIYSLVFWFYVIFINHIFKGDNIVQHSFSYNYFVFLFYIT